METSPILFLDSGVGGLPYLDMARRVLAQEHFVYIADTAHFPYGQKSDLELRRLIVDMVAELISKFHPKAIVVACNTASVVALQELRGKFSVPFIGVVPAVKPAAAIHRPGKLGILATRQTIEGEYLESLISAFAADAAVEKIALKTLVDFIEYYYFEKSARERLKAVSDETELGIVAERGVRTVVLGCTHFTVAEKEIKTVLGNDIHLIDSRQGVINQLLRVVKNPQKTAAADNQLFITDNSARGRYLAAAEAYKLGFGGVLG